MTNNNGKFHNSTTSRNRKIYYQNGSSVRQTFRALRPVFGAHNRPSERTIRRVMEKLEATGSVADKKKPAVRQRRKSSNEIITGVRESVCMNPEKFSRDHKNWEFN